MLDNSPESPASVRFVTEGIKAHIEKLGAIWMEGEVAQLTERSGATAFIRLKDLNEDMSISVSVFKNVLASVKPLSDNARIVVLAKPSWYLKNGSLSMQASEIREVGIGELLARLEALKNKLAAEGLFDLDRKIALPLLPRKVGIICGKNTDAEKDVVENARRRWPAVEFVVKEVTVQGAKAVSEVTAALKELESHPDVEVIVITRGGGSFEDLLPFSDEGLIRLASSCQTPIVSAIGHEKDSPLLDLVADYRASTPTDAGKRIVPDIAQEIADISKLQDRAMRALTNQIDAESSLIAQLISRPIMKDPMVFVTTRLDELRNLRDRALRSFATTIDAESKELKAITAHIRSLSPQSTLDRGYSVVRTSDGDVVRDPQSLKKGDQLHIKVAKGEIGASVN